MCFSPFIFLFYLYFQLLKNENKMNLAINIIPQPQSVITGKGSLDLRTIDRIIIKTDSKQELAVAQFFQKLLKPINHIG